MVTWEKVLETGFGGVWRARVDGGWLVSQRYGAEPEVIEFELVSQRYGAEPEVIEFVPDDATTGPRD